MERIRNVYRKPSPSSPSLFYFLPPSRRTSVGKRTPGMLASLRRIQLDSRSSVDNASIVARLDGDDSGEAPFGIIRFVPISSPSRLLPSSFPFVDYYHLCPTAASTSIPAALLSSPSPTAPRLLRSSFYVVEQSRAPSLLRGAEGFGKTWLSDRTAPLCYRRRISREPKG